MIPYWFYELKNLFKVKGVFDEKGQTLVEYALILLLIAIAVIAAVTIFGTEVNNLYQRILDEWPSYP